MNVCEVWCCCCGEIWSKRVLPLRRKLVKEKEGAWRRRIYRKYASCKWLKDVGLEFTRADVVVSISRGPPRQWFPETEYWASAIFVGKSGIPPKIIYRSVKSFGFDLFGSLIPYTPTNKREKDTELRNPVIYIPGFTKTRMFTSITTLWLGLEY